MTKGSAHLYLIFVLLAFFWGGSFVAIKEIVGVLPSWSSAALRLWVASISIYVIFKTIFKADLKLPKGTYPRIWWTGLVTLGIPFAFLFWGEKHVSAGLAGIINGAVPIFTALMVWSFPTPDEKNSIGMKSFLGLALGFVGIVSIFSPLIQRPGSLEFFGALAVLAMAILYAWGNVLNKRNFANIPGLNIYASVFHQHIASLIFLSLGAVLFEPLPSIELIRSKPSLIPSILYLGIFSTALALTLYFYLIKIWGSVRTSAIAYLIPVFTLILDALIFGSTPHASSFAGIAMIFLGIFFIRKDAQQPESSKKSIIEKTSSHRRRVQALRPSASENKVRSNKRN